MAFDEAAGFAVLDSGVRLFAGIADAVYKRSGPARPVDGKPRSTIVPGDSHLEVSPVRTCSASWSSVAVHPCCAPRVAGDSKA